MKIARIESPSHTGWALVDPEARTVRPFSRTIAEWGPRVLAEGEAALGELREPLSLDEVKLLAPLEDDAVITGTGTNYEDWTNQDGHAGTDRWAEPPFYFKPRTVLIGNDDTILYPEIIASEPWCRYVYELELVAVIAHPIDEAPGGVGDVLGYAVGNDGCLRGQTPSFAGMDLIGSKSGHHSSAIGPWIVTADEFPPGQPDLHMEARLNGVVTQKHRTSAMTWPLDKLVEEISLRTRLKAGDVIYTGTCGYIGVPDGFTSPGDLLEMEIEGLGTLTMHLESPHPLEGAYEKWHDEAKPAVDAWYAALHHPALKAAVRD